MKPKQHALCTICTEGVLLKGNAIRCILELYRERCADYELVHVLLDGINIIIRIF